MHCPRFFVVTVVVVLSLVAFPIKWAVAMGTETADGKLCEQAVQVTAVRTFGTDDDIPASRDQFQVRPGFQVERLFTVPGEQLGSWVSLCVDPKGRLIASDQQGKGLCRIIPSPLGSKEPTKVERLNVKLLGAQGLLYAFESLYVSVNGPQNSPNGLYRLRDTDGDDQFDEVVQLKSIRGHGEHGPHALILAPDGQSIYWIAGNYTAVPEDFHASRLPMNWQEDQLLPRMWDLAGQPGECLAPAGWIAKTDPEGKTWEIISSGYRNAYDMAFKADGELFVYDSDSERDLGMPWYCPTRLSHTTSGAELGWRAGSGRWPRYYADSLPAVIDLGAGSPTGVTFGYGAKFPAKYQRALFLLDWTFGTIYAVHLEPNGATYQATKEEFLTRAPLPLTDAVIGTDGTLYFTTGGRGTQSELFRVTYVGKESTAPIDYRDSRSAEERELRRKLEALHHRAEDLQAAISFAYPHLSHPDRFMRYAARVALEHQETKLWQDRVLTEKDPQALITGAVGLARQGASSLQSRLLAALERLDFSSLDETQQLELLRAWNLIFIRLGAPDRATATSLTHKLGAFFPTKSDFVNRELINLLVYLQSPKIAATAIALLQAPSSNASHEQVPDFVARNATYGGPVQDFLQNQPDVQKLHYAFVLRQLKAGWNVELRTAYFQFLREARTKSGGLSYQGFLNNIDLEAYETCTEQERLAIDASGARQALPIPELPKPKGPGQSWTLSHLLPLAERVQKGRDFQNGKTMYAAARCIVCHRFGIEGGATGPDLTQVAGRFGFQDLCTAIVEPSKVVSDQYRATNFVTTDGQVISGRVFSETTDRVTVLTDPQDPTKAEMICKQDIEEQRLSLVSWMPNDLLNPLSENEVLDLLAYLLSRGNPNDPAFQP
jgi:putative heme-binding domain-containing protein